MINLLPPEEKAKLLFEKKKKLVIILGITAIIPLVCFILMLLSINFYILGEINSAKITLQLTQKEYQTPDFLTFKDIIRKNNSVISNLESFYKKEIYISQTLKVIALVGRPQNLYFTDLALNRNAHQTIDVVASGFSNSRDNLLTFQKNIKASQNIQNVYFSPESWVDAQNVKFHLTFNINLAQ